MKQNSSGGVVFLHSVGKRTLKFRHLSTIKLKCLVINSQINEIWCSSGLEMYKI